MAEANYFEDIPADIFAASCATGNTNLQTNGALYNYVPNNNLAAEKNFSSVEGVPAASLEGCHNGKIKKERKKGMGRGRPRKALVAMYHSQISGDKNTIKIRIKKSNFTAQVQVHYQL